MDFIKNNIWNLIGILIGICAILIGFFWFGGFSGSYHVSNITFGADFYTEIYNVTAKIANRADSIYFILYNGFKWLFVFMGCIDICFFAGRVKPVENEVRCTKPEMEGQTVETNE